MSKTVIMTLGIIAIWLFIIRGNSNTKVTSSTNENGRTSGSISGGKIIDLKDTEQGDVSDYLWNNSAGAIKPKEESSKPDGLSEYLWKQAGGK